MNEAAADAPLEGVGAANALDDAVANGFAGVLDRFDAGLKWHASPVGSNGAIEFEFKRGGLMPYSEAYFVPAAHEAFNRRAGREKIVFTADQISGENGAD